MQPVCLFLIIVLGFIALWLVLEGSNKMASNREYHFSGGTATDPHNLYATEGIGPRPQYAADIIYPPYNPYANARPAGENFGNPYTVKFLSDIFS